jgi:DNA-binding transcriptional LysR family regulator
MNLRQLYYFKTLAATEHYTEAATSLFITQPSLSHAISELEKELGVVLFEKYGRNIRITKYGKMFLPYVENALNELENGKNVLQQVSGLTGENVNLGFIYTMGEVIVPQLIDQFTHTQGHEKVTFSFSQGTTLSIVQDLKTEKIDLAICSHVAEEPEVEFIPIISQELVLVTSRDHPLATSENGVVDLADAAEYPFVFFSENSGLRPIIDKMFTQKKVVPKIACYVEEDTAMVGLVSINYGIAIMPRINTLSYSNVNVMEIKNPGQKRYVYLASRKDKILSPSASAFKEFIINFSKSALIK